MTNSLLVRKKRGQVGAFDIFCLPSVAKSEASGIVLPEARVCGKPCVSTNLLVESYFVNEDGKTYFGPTKRFHSSGKGYKDFP